MYFLTKKFDLTQYCAETKRGSRNIKIDKIDDLAILKEKMKYEKSHRNDSRSNRYDSYESSDKYSRRDDRRRK